MITIDGYAIDASLTEGHNFAAEVTEYPVEQGSDITDNTRNLPIEVEIEGVVSDTPIGNMVAIRQLQSSNAAGDLKYLPSDDALGRLLAIRDAREPVTIETSLKVFDNMVMFHLEVPRDPKTGAALRFSANFRQVVLITNQRTTVRVAPPSGGNPSGAKKKDKGGAPPVDKVQEWRDQVHAYASKGKQLKDSDAKKFDDQIATLADRGKKLEDADQAKFLSSLHTVRAR